MAEFKKMNTWEFNTDDWQTRVWFSTMIDQSDYSWTEEWQYWTETIYKCKVNLPNENITWPEEKEIEFRYNESKKALWKVIVDWNEYVVRKFVNDDWVVTIFKYNDKRIKVKKKKNKNDDTYFTIWFSYIKEDAEEETKDEEIPF